MLKKSFNKKGQVMGMPFQMIFTLILIAIFAIVGVVAIKYVVSWQSQAQVSLFVNEFKNKADNLRSVEISDYRFNSSLPASIKYVCFANSSLQNTTSLYPEIWDEFKNNPGKNMILYPINNKNYVQKIDYINLKEISNPFCLKNSGKISIHLAKESDEAIAKIVA